MKESLNHLCEEKKSSPPTSTFIVEAPKVVDKNDISYSRKSDIAHSRPAEDHSVLHGKFSLGEVIGVGGYAVVKQGCNMKTNEQVAIKIVHRRGTFHHKISWIMLK